MMSAQEVTKESPARAIGGQIAREDMGRQGVVEPEFSPKWVVGIELDHTLISYASQLQRWAEEFGVVAPPDMSLKDAVRQHCWESPDGDVAWLRVQADLYAYSMSEATLAPDALNFLRVLNSIGVPVHIVSHKTEHATAAQHGPNLRETALAWMTENGLFASDTGLSPERVHFVATLDEKVARIASLGCTHFIDDLPKVFQHPRFPPETQQFLLGKTVVAPGAWNVAESWTRVILHFAVALEAFCKQALSDRLGRPVARMKELPGGRNSTAYEVTLGDKSTCFAKLHLDDERLVRERDTLRYLETLGVANVPKLLPDQDDAALLLTGFVAGASPVADITTNDIDDAVEFIAAINQTPPPGVTWTEAAAEARFALEDVRGLVSDRATRLLAGSERKPIFEAMRDFVRDDILKLLETIPLEGDPAPLPRAARILSPSDFGFHNAIRQADGRLVFVDFKYFGWDDPAKLVSDFLWHPGMSLSESQKEHFVAGIGETLDSQHFLATRLPAAYPLFGLKWCLILLNEFLPRDWERRTFAGDNRPREQVLAEQLDKARAIAQEVRALRGKFPYLD